MPKAPHSGVPNYTRKNLNGSSHWKKWCNCKIPLPPLMPVARAAYQNTTRLLLLTVLAVALGVAIAFVIIRAITKPISRAMEITHAVAAGDLSIEIEAEGESETSQLLIALRSMKDKLIDIVGGVRQSAERVATASGEIATGNNELSSRTESQASALE